MTKEEAIDLVHQAISSGIFNDLGSGGNVDITVITPEGVEIKRTYDAPNPRKYRRPQPYVFEPGTVPVVSEKSIPLSARVIITDDTGATDAMVL
jgi:20S proteasome subunit beta 2